MPDPPISRDPRVDLTQPLPRLGEVTDSQIRDWLVSKVAGFLAVTPEQIDVTKAFEHYGVDSAEAASMAGELGEWLGRSVEPTLLWDYPSICLLSEYLSKKRVQVKSTGEVLSNGNLEPIAIVGIGCRVPGANGPVAFWRQLASAEAAILTAPPAEREPMKGHAGRHGCKAFYLRDVDRFDPDFFNISAREAASTDPQQRVLLEVAWEALENASLNPEKLRGSKTGVFIGISNSDYLRMLLSNGEIEGNPFILTGNALSVAANRISYFLDLHGPSVAIDTACSSSLVAVHLACQSLKSGEVDVAIAGGINLILSSDITILLDQAGVLASDGRCKTFDADADGFGRGEGCGIVVLKRLSNALAENDRIFALVKGSAVNQDGRSNGLTAPNGRSQRAVIEEALQRAQVHPRQISYVEAHGSGTSLGDAIEIEALADILGRERKSPDSCCVGSVKTNVGHLEAAAGVAGLIKVALALHNAKIPAHLNLRTLSSHIKAGEEYALNIPRKTIDWKVSGERYAGVSSFGIGGTNAHIVLSQAPYAEEVPSSPDRTCHVFTLSARNDTDLHALAELFQSYLRQEPLDRLADICFSVNTGRYQFTHRLAIEAQSIVDLRDGLTAFQADTGRQFAESQKAPGALKPAFVFLGDRFGIPQSGSLLYETQPSFRRIVNQCAEITRELFGIPLPTILSSPGAGRPPQSEEHDRLRLFVFQYALARLLQSWGVYPTAIIGHGIGEYVASCLADVLDLETAMKLTAKRACLMEDLKATCKMAVVFTNRTDLEVALQPYMSQVWIAAANTPSQTIFCGFREVVEALVVKLQALGMRTELLDLAPSVGTSRAAASIEELIHSLGARTFCKPGLPLVSSLTGRLLEVAPDARYWGRQISNPIMFGEGIEALLDQGCNAFIEIGPTSPFPLFDEKRLGIANASWLSLFDPSGDQWRQLSRSLAALYTQGLQVDWAAFDADYSRKRVGLPTYPFAREKVWFRNGTSHKRSQSVVPAHRALDRTKDPGQGSTAPSEDAGGLPKALEGPLESRVSLNVSGQRTSSISEREDRPDTDSESSSATIQRLINRQTELAAKVIGQQRELVAYSMKNSDVGTDGRKLAQNDFNAPADCRRASQSSKRSEETLATISPWKRAKRVSELDERNTEIEELRSRLKQDQDTNEVVASLKRQVVSIPDAVAIDIEGQCRTYWELYEHAAFIAKKLARLGGSRRVIGLGSSEPYLIVVGLIAILMSDGVCVLIEKESDYQQPLGGPRRIAALLTSGSAVRWNDSLFCPVIPLDSPETDVSAGPIGDISTSSEAIDPPTAFMWNSEKRPATDYRNLVKLFDALDARLGGKEPGVALKVGTSFREVSLLEAIWLLTRGWRLSFRRSLTPTTQGRLPSNSHKLQFSLSYFGDYGEDAAQSGYAALFEGARFADRKGFSAVWLPERHFHSFGGIFPNPAVLAAALARETKQIGIRAGSVVVPLHNPVRIAEEWSVVDNLSQGRVGIAFASGWHPTDFILASGSYEHRRTNTIRGMQQVRRLWREGRTTIETPGHPPMEIQLFPRPVQRDLPTWLTIVSNPDTYVKAGELGLSVLTNLMSQSLSTLKANIRAYRETLARFGHDPATRSVTLLVHTFLGEDLGTVREVARQPFKHYLGSSADLFGTFLSGAKSTVSLDSFAADERDDLFEIAYDRYVKSSALIGTIDSCSATAEELFACGVTELACLVDFGFEREVTLKSLNYLATLRSRITDTSWNDPRWQDRTSTNVRVTALLGPASELTSSAIRNATATGLGLSSLDLLLVEGDLSLCLDPGDLGRVPIITEIEVRAILEAPIGA